MEKDFVPYEQALALRELEFDEPCFATIDQTDYLHIKGTKKIPRGSMMYDTIDCPTFSQAFRFFREKYDLVGWIRRRAGFHKEYSWYISDFNDDDPNEYEFDLHIETYEEAELECLKKLIEIVKEQNE